MNKIIIITFGALFVLSSFEVYAQSRTNAFDKESFLSERKAFITSELGLTPREVEQFIPLMEELQQKKFEAGQKCRKLSKDIKQKNSLTDGDYLIVIDECLGASLKEAELEKDYYEKFKKILSPEKLYKYKDVEFKFTREFVRNNSREGQERTRRGEKLK
ncbi:hypothetical protein FACS189415_1000 [Bacteroidia bacterium]|nr:hypothetical protein FACS189415_1000 [Bacteroidia bacterium]